MIKDEILKLQTYKLFEGDTDVYVNRDEVLNLLANNSPKLANKNGELISREQAINALWKALYDYEDKTEKQYQESDELNVADWIGHRHYVQNMSDIDRKTILDLPTIEPRKGRWINHLNDDGHNIADCSECGHALQWFDDEDEPKYCCLCGSYNGGQE